jgi:hypothetical protein
MAALLARRQELYEIEFPEKKAGVAGGTAGGRGRPKDCNRQIGSGYRRKRPASPNARSIARPAGAAPSAKALAHVKGTSLTKASSWTRWRSCRSPSARG